MPSKPRAMVDVRARIALLERRRISLMSTADTAATVAHMYGQMLAGQTAGAPRAGRGRAALITKYRELHAARLADSAIAKAHARCLAIEICALRAISGESLQGTQR